MFPVFLYKTIKLFVVAISKFILAILVVSFVNPSVNSITKKSEAVTSPAARTKSPFQVTAVFP